MKLDNNIIVNNNNSQSIASGKLPGLVPHFVPKHLDLSKLSSAHLCIPTS